MDKKYGPVVVSGVLAVLLVAAVASAQTVSDPTLLIEEFASAAGEGGPSTMTFIGDNDILVAYLGTGEVRRILNGVLDTNPVLDVAVQSIPGGRGLYGIQADPDFINNSYVYVYYTESSSDVDQGPPAEPAGNRLYRYTWNGTALVDPQLILDIPADPQEFHNGGIIAFGPDDRLHLIAGDQERRGKLQNVPDGPDPDDTGVIFRVNAKGGGLPDNPFYDATDPTDPMNRYFAYGIRNSFGMAFDPVTGELWQTENGPLVYDEINRIPPGFNGGHHQIWGPDARDPEGLGDLWHAPGSTYRDPEFSWSVPVAPTAIAFHRGRKLGCALENDIFVGDVNCGHVYHFQPDGPRTGLSFSSPDLQDLVADNALDLCHDEQTELVFAEGLGIITDIETGPDGYLYVLTRSPARKIYRIRPVAGAVTDLDGDEVDDACDCDNTAPGAFAAPMQVPRLRVTDDGATNLGWDSQSVTAGSGTTYTVVSGRLSSLAVDGGFDASCTLATELGVPQLTDPRAVPSPGEGDYYLVNAVNACGAGTFGDGTGTPDPRDDLATPLPRPCL